MPHPTTTSSSSSPAVAISAGRLAGAAGHVAFRCLGAGSWTPTPSGLRAQRVRRNAATGAGGGVGAPEQLTFYQLLGISSDGTFEEVRAAYRRMARKYHPDVSPPGAAEENTRRFIEVQEAYETLSDPSRRASYDRALARGLCLLAFSAFRRGFHEEQEERSGWRNSWQDQISELKRSSMRKDSDENLSWGARMRRRRAESSAE